MDKVYAEMRANENTATTYKMKRCEEQEKKMIWSDSLSLDDLRWKINTRPDKKQNLIFEN